MNNICEILGIKYPIIQGGMGNVSNAVLTAAVSEAGGLGTLGTGTMKPEEIEAMIIDVQQRTSKPFAVNIAISVTPFLQEIIDIIVKHNVPVVSLSAGNPAPYVSLFKEKGMKVMAVVASVKHAKKAEDAKVDIVIAEGYEAAGINSNDEVTTFTLIPQIADHVNIPIIAAGGVGDGRGLLAAFSLGADGVQMGTRFIATKEAPFHDEYKQRLLHASETETVIIGRSLKKVRRVLHAPYTTKLLQIERLGMNLEEYNELTSEDKHVLGAVKGNLEEGFVNSGQVAGLIQSIPSVSELIEGMITQAQEQHNRVKNGLFFLIKK